MSSSADTWSYRKKAYWWVINARLHSRSGTTIKQKRRRERDQRIKQANGPPSSALRIQSKGISSQPWLTTWSFNTAQMSTRESQILKSSCMRMGQERISKMKRYGIPIMMVGATTKPKCRFTLIQPCNSRMRKPLACHSLRQFTKSNLKEQANGLPSS